VVAPTRRRTPIVVIAGAEARDLDRNIPELASEGPREVFFLESSGLKATASVARAIEALAPCDICLLAWPCLVTSRWLKRLRGAAYSDSICAGASALADAGTPLALDDAACSGASSTSPPTTSWSAGWRR